MENRDVGVTDEGLGSETITVEMRSDLEIFMFRHALINANEASKYKGATTPDDMQKELEHSMIAILMSHLCLEAYINRIGVLRLAMHPEKERQTLWESLERANPQSKWVIITKLATKTGQTFVKSEEPLKSFEWLMELRNYIVHYRGLPKKSVGMRGPYPITEAQAKLSADNAKKAVDIVKKMIVKFHELDQSTYPQWLKGTNNNKRES